MPSDPVSAATTGLPEETRTISDAISLLCRARSLNELIFMAGEGIAIREMKEAITTAADLIDGMLGEVKTILYANADQPARRPATDTRRDER